ncbi:MAG: IS1595 family transposase [Rhizomicrobium sp.]|jgi:transposase-like protein
MSNEPKTLLEAIQYFSDPDVALKTMVELRWPNGVYCPTCGRTDVRYIATRRMWECKEKHPRKQFTAKVGTIFEDSAIPLEKWLPAVWLVANCKNGISSYEMARDLGVTQKTSWFMDHRIRLAMKTGTFLKVKGDYEADETFVGGLSKNMHIGKRNKVITGTGGTNKAAVMGILKRNNKKGKSKVKAAVVPDVRKDTLHAHIYDTVEPGSNLYTDKWVGYRGLSGDFQHEVVDHAIEYVRGNVHTNGIENFWSLLKRTIKGTYVSVEPFHLGRYIDEQAFRFNERDCDDAERFKKVMRSVSGKRLTYKALTTGEPKEARA